MTTLSHSDARNYNPYDLLRVYTYYRTLLGSLLLIMFELQVRSEERRVGKECVP